MSDILEFTGTLLIPDSTGDYFEIEDYEGNPCHYNSVTGWYHFWNIYTSYWYVSPQLGGAGQYYWISEDMISSEYSPGGESSGIGDMHVKSISGHYHIYRGQDGHIDYVNVQATMSLVATSVTIPNQVLPPGTRWDYIRRQVSECGLESEDSPLCKVVIDADGEMVPLCSNSPSGLAIEPVAAGKFKLRWRYNAIEQELPLAGFKIYSVNAGEWNLLDTLAYSTGGSGEFEWTSSEFEDGQRCHFGVHSYADGGGESQNTNVVSATADAIGPGVLTGLETAVEEL